MVCSPSVKALIELLVDRCNTALRFHPDRQTNLDMIVEKVSSAIIGKQISDAMPLLHELISGPYDADKLDYFVRDAKLAGTPSASAASGTARTRSTGATPMMTSRTILIRKMV